MDGAGGYRALAQLQLAGSQNKQGKKAEALATYEALANDGSADPMLRDFARLQAAGAAHRRGRLYRDGESAHAFDG